MSPATPNPMRTTHAGSGVDAHVGFLVGGALVTLVITVVPDVFGTAVVGVVI